MVTHLETKFVGQLARDEHFVDIGSVGNDGHATVNQVALEVGPVVAVIDTTIDDAFKVGVGLENGRLVGNETHALHLACHCAVGHDALVDGLGVDCRIVVVKPQGGIRHLEVGIELVNFARNLLLEPKHHRQRENHHHDGEDNARQCHIEAGCGMTRVGSKTQALCYVETIVQRSNMN